MPENTCTVLYSVSLKCDKEYTYIVRLLTQLEICLSIWTSCTRKSVETQVTVNTDHPNFNLQNAFPVELYTCTLY